MREPFFLAFYLFETKFEKKNLLTKYFLESFYFNISFWKGQIFVALFWQFDKNENKNVFHWTSRVLLLFIKKREKMSLKLSLKWFFGVWWFLSFLHNKSIRSDSFRNCVCEIPILGIGLYILCKSIITTQLRLDYVISRTICYVSTCS